VSTVAFPPQADPPVGLQVGDRELRAMVSADRISDLLKLIRIFVDVVY